MCNSNNPCLLILVSLVTQPFLHKTPGHHRAHPSFTDLERTLHRQNLAFETSKKRKSISKKRKFTAFFSDVRQSKTLRLKRLNQEELKMLKYDKLWDGNGVTYGILWDNHWNEDNGLKSIQKSFPTIITTSQNHPNKNRTKPNYSLNSSLFFL